MSSVEMPIILSPQAEEDIADILQHTFEKWGEDKTYDYRAVLDEALLTIGRFPKIGRICQGISGKHRIFSAGSHVIVYWIAADAIYVSRILHERMDIRRHGMEI